MMHGELAYAESDKIHNYSFRVCTYFREFHEQIYPNTYLFLFFEHGDLHRLTEILDFSQVESSIMVNDTPRGSIIR
jgi:hypothetical protein